MKRFFWICSIAVVCGYTPALAAREGEAVVVIYNTRVPESKSIAEHYAERRMVPASQVFGFDLPTGDTMSRKDYREGLQNPLLKKLEALKLWRFGAGDMPGTNGQPIRVPNKVVESKIRYAVLCYGVPWAIARDVNLKEAAEENMRPEFRRNEAAVDSELACLPLIHRELPLAGPLHNPLYTSTNEWTLHPTNGLLMVARLDGPTPQIASALVDKAITAETDGMWGRAYIDLRNATEPNLKTGDDWLRGAAEGCRFMGFETVVEETGATFPPGFPMSQIAIYIGWYTENVNGPFTQPNVEFMPGAFAYHLHSYSAAALHSTNRNWVGPLLAKGATITMGTVDEPYLSGTPDMGVFTTRLLYYRFAFGAAAYASQNTLSWQTTVVGDPLYRPFEKPPHQIHQELEQRQNKLVEWSHLRVVNLHLARKTSAVAETISYLQDVPTTKISPVLQEKLGDLCFAEGKPTTGISAYEQALTLNPSRLQRLRLRLTLGEKLMGAGRLEDAAAQYQKLLEELPDYPDKTAIVQKLQALTQKLGKKDDAAKYRDQLAHPPSGTSTNK